MDMTGERRIPAPQQTVWEALNDTDVLKASIPGCESVDKKSDTEFTANVQLAIGPVKARFSGDVKLNDLDPPNSYTLVGQGSGGAAGFGKGEARVSLREENGETVISYTAHATVGGKLAQIGQRLVDSTAKKLTDQFFNNFVNHLTKSGETPPEPQARPEAAAKAAEPASSRPAAVVGGGWTPLLILAAIAVVVLWMINR